LIRHAAAAAAIGILVTETFFGRATCAGQRPEVADLVIGATGDRASGSVET
jgi:hypothetical protein